MLGVVEARLRHPDVGELYRRHLPQRFRGRTLTAHLVAIDAGPALEEVGRHAQCSLTRLSEQLRALGRCDIDARGQRHLVGGSLRIDITAEIARAVMTDDHAQRLGGITVRHRALRLGRIEVEAVAGRAVRLHLDGREARCARIGHMAIGALHHHIPLRRLDALGVEMCRVRELETRRRCLDADGADAERRMLLREIGDGLCALSRAVLQRLRMAIGAGA